MNVKEHVQIRFDHLALQPEQETRRIVENMQNQLINTLRRRGYIIALSGGIDSTVTAALCVRALGADNVLGLLMPERHSASETAGLGEVVTDWLGIRKEIRNITPVLDAVGCYSAQDEAIRSVIPEYKPGNPFKISLPQIGQGYRIFQLTVQTDDGQLLQKRMPHESYLQLVAATNYKQRVRKMLEYFYADKYNYAVAGSPNRQEYDQGFFVKNGDGSADIKPIAHLYKTQVYQLAEYLGVPEQIRKRPPTTDTYPLEQSQEEFYFSLPFDKMDVCLYAKNNNIPLASVCEATGLTEDQVEFVYKDIESKRRTTRYQHLHPLLVEKVDEISAG
ncbi:MAG: NAD(+) synthase [Chitinispirillaceae bacterium]